MCPLPARRISILSSFWAPFPEIDREVERVQKTLTETLTGSQTDLRPLLEDAVGGGGKMLRPGLLLLASRFGRGVDDRIRALAGAVELFHVATLVHDDVLDEAETRRGAHTLHKLAGVHVAVLAGELRHRSTR